jgi:plasmid maintenance system antidote protein VapI
MAQEYLPAPSNVRLADLMKEHNISQPELAKELGCSKSTINRFISGAKGTLTHEQVLKIARLFSTCPRIFCLEKPISPTARITTLPNWACP